MTIKIVDRCIRSYRIKKATIAWPMVKPASTDQSFFFPDIRSSHLDQGIAVMIHNPTYRVSHEQWPVFMANRYFYQLGPLSAEVLSVSPNNNFKIVHSLKFLLQMAYRFTCGITTCQMFGKTFGTKFI